MTASDRRHPLQGIRVLDCSHYVSAATCGLMLADLGASVVKVERVGGDDLRRLGPQLGGAAASFQWANRNKQGLVLDLKTDAGRGLAVELAQQADVFIENYSTGVMERLGLGPERLRALNPRLVYCSIPAYARSGPQAGRQGFDPIVQAECGLMSITGPEGSGGCRVGAPVADVGSGLLAAIATLGALVARGHSGIGQHVEVALFDSAVTLAAIPIMNYLASGIVPQPAGSASREAAPTDFYQASDGALYIACTSDTLFERLARDVLEQHALVQDARFCTNAQRLAHRAELRAALEAVLGTRSRRHWHERCVAAQVPSGLMNDIPQALAADEFTSRGLLGQAMQEGGGSGGVPALALPFRFSGMPAVAPRPAPALGEHRHEVLAHWLGMAPEREQALAAAGAFGPGAASAAGAPGGAS